MTSLDKGVCQLKHLILSCIKELFIKANAGVRKWLASQEDKIHRTILGGQPIAKIVFIF